MAINKAAFLEPITLNPDLCSQYLAVSTKIFLEKSGSKVSLANRSLFTHWQKENAMGLAYLL